MVENDFYLKASDGKDLFCRHWPAQAGAKAGILVVHGMIEHSARYRSMAAELCVRGYDVWALDLRGHGETASEGELGYMGERHSFDRSRDDIHELAALIRAQGFGKPLFLLGHSMGSFIARYCSADPRRLFDAYLFSGTAGPSALYALGRGLTSIICLLGGKRHPSDFLQNIALGPYNKPFRPNRSRADWLSRDTAEVDAYLADPLCSFTCSAVFYKHLMSGLARINTRAFLKKVPLETPMYFFSGSMDSVSQCTRTLQRLLRRLRRMGFTRVAERIWPESRHETLHDLDRELVVAACADWMDAHIAGLRKGT